MSEKKFSPNAATVETADKTLFYGFVIKRNFKPSNVTVGTSSVSLAPTPLAQRIVMMITNNSINTLYVGDSTVTTANGTPVDARGGVIILLVEDTVDVWGVADGSGSDIRILEGS